MLNKLSGLLLGLACVTFSIYWLLNDGTKNLVEFGALIAQLVAGMRMIARWDA